MPFIRIQITLVVIELFLSSCSQNNLPTPQLVAATKTSSPTPTQQPTVTISPTNTRVSCPPFEIDHDVPEPNVPENYIGRHYRVTELPIELVFHQGTTLLGGSNNYGFT